MEQWSNGASMGQLMSKALTCPACAVLRFGSAAMGPGCRGPKNRPGGKDGLRKAAAAGISSHLG
jgi:hypothetical protein